MFAKLGGIGATLQITLGSLLPLFMIEFAVLINGVIRRKQKESQRFFKIEIMSKQIKKCEKKIKALLKDADQQENVDKLQADLELS